MLFNAIIVFVGAGIAVVTIFAIISALVNNEEF
jgi:hypothetical protein